MLSLLQKAIENKNKDAAGERKQASEEEVKYMRKVYQIKQLQKQLYDTEILLKEERQKSALLDDKISNIKEAQNRDKNAIRNKLKEEIHQEFGKKLASVELLYKNELECLKNGYQDLKLVSNAKDDAVRHLVDIMKNQECLISEFKVKTKRDFEGKIELADFGTSHLEIINNPKIIKVKPFINHNFIQPLFICKNFIVEQI